MIKSLSRLTTLSRTRKRLILAGYDFAAVAAALWAAFSVRLGVVFVPSTTGVFVAAVASALACLLTLYRLKVYHIILRYFDLRSVSNLFGGAAVAAVTWVLAVYLMQAQITVNNLSFWVPRSVGFIYCGFLFLLLFMGRYIKALVLSGAARGTWLIPSTPGVSVAIYGANAVGIMLARSMRENEDYRLVAFVDDDPALQGQIAAGVPIRAPGALAELARAYELDEVFLAMPKASRSQRLAAISLLTQLNLRVKTVPAPEEIVSGRFTVSDVRPINVSDLLRRDPVEPLTQLIRQAVEDHSILVTGAGGSIGSEICRQIVQARPGRLVLLDHSEFALYTIEQQLEELLSGEKELPQPEIVPVVGSMLDEKLVREIIHRHGIDTIYHAAAYKHVPLLERNEPVGVANNVIGTLILARAAADAGLARFTMISTDKAVRPESVMGASKRVAELVIQAYSSRPGNRTRFGIVRFGNVLDSSGSVVQRFRQQIRQGGPVTVTHPEVTRYFMSIPEATQLVLQASAMAEKGEVYVLDMGEAIRISDLAKNMIRLSGMTVRDVENPQGDIEITFVGLRPGEKLHEELFVGESFAPTAHPRIRMANERFLPLEDLLRHIERLQAATAERNSEAVRKSLWELLAPDQSKLPPNVRVLRRGSVTN